MMTRFLRRREVEGMTGLSRSSIYKGMEDGWFPQAVKVSPRAVRWRLDEIEAWMSSRPTTAPPDLPPAA